MQQSQCAGHQLGASGQAAIRNVPCEHLFDDLEIWPMFSPVHSYSWVTRASADGPCAPAHTVRVTLRVSCEPARHLTPEGSNAEADSPAGAEEAFSGPVGLPPRGVVDRLAPGQRVAGAMLFVRGLDCLDGTPLIDLKPDRCAFTPLAPPQPGDTEVESSAVGPYPYAEGRLAGRPFGAQLFILYNRTGARMIKIATMTVLALALSAA
jgi:hypothetical protein